MRISDWSSDVCSSDLWECGKAAQDHAARVLGEADAQIRLTRRFSYGRPVATVTVKGRDLGETLIRAGLAIHQPEFLKTDPARAKQYTEAFAAAQHSKTSEERRVGKECVDR